MMVRGFLVAMTTLFLAAGLLAACSTSPRATFYTLSAIATSETGSPVPVSVDVGPVTLPAMVDQPQLVVRSAPNQVEVLEMQRWAEPLKNGIAQAIAADLATLLPQARVSAYPQSAGLDADYRVQVDVQRFDMIKGEGVTLDLLWSVRRTGGGGSNNGRSVVRESAGADYDSLVAAQSRALAAVSRDVAQALRNLATAKR